MDILPSDLSTYGGEAKTCCVICNPAMIFDDLSCDKLADTKKRNNVFGGGYCTET